MNSGQFTAQAALLWGTISREARERILKNVHCGKCLGATEIVRFTGKVEGGDVILRGSCARCGHGVVRLVETSERDLSRN